MKMNIQLIFHSGLPVTFVILAYNLFNIYSCRQCFESTKQSVMPCLLTTNDIALSLSAMVDEIHVMPCQGMVCYRAPLQGGMTWESYADQCWPLYLWYSYHLLIPGAQLWKPLLVYLTQYSIFIRQNTILILISQISLRNSPVMVATVLNWKAYACLNSQHCATRLYWTRLLHNRSIYIHRNKAEYYLARP